VLSLHLLGYLFSGFVLIINCDNSESWIGIAAIVSSATATAAAILSGSAQQLLKTQELDKFDSPHDLVYKHSSSNFKYFCFNDNFE
jgi:hypothetical protein